MGRSATPQIRTACGMGRCPRKFATVATAMKHVLTHPPIAAPKGRFESVWKVAWTRTGEIREVIAGPLPNLPIYARQNAQDGLDGANPPMATE